MGAHAALAQLAMETAYTGASDAARGAILSQNTEQLSQAIASMYGPAAGQEFKTMWAGHIQDCVHYVVATKSHNASGQQAALNTLSQYKDKFSELLAKANPHYNATVLEDSLQVHVNQLITTFKDFLAQDPSAAIPAYVTAYDHMFMLGDYLAQGIVEQFPSKCGVTMVNGATSPVTGIPFIPAMALGAAIAVVGTALLIRRRESAQ